MQLYRNIVINAYYQLNQLVKNCTEINKFIKCLLNYIKSTQTRVIIKTSCRGFVVHTWSKFVGASWHIYISVNRLLIHRRTKPSLNDNDDIKA